MNRFNKNKKQVSIFITAGYPKKESLIDQLLFLQDSNVDFIEVGIPFSDPMADGPVIQETSSIALGNGMNLELIFQQLTEIESRIEVPIVLMGYLNTVLQYGLEKFLQRCSDLKIASLILPDMSVELFEAKYKSSFQKFGIPATFLVSPRTPNDRIQRITQICVNSFVYLVGQNSTTGLGYEINETLQQRYKEIKRLCAKTPLFLGFGIDSKEKKEQGFESCDGVIIGTAFLKSLKAGKETDFINSLEHGEPAEVGK